MSNHYEEYGIKRRKISVWSIVGMVYMLTAAGAFGIEEMISASGPGMAALLLVLIPMFWSLPQAACSAELGSAMPEEGGFYYWAQKSLGEYWGFQIGWWRVINIYLAHVSTLVLAVNYLGSIIPMSGMQSYIVKAILIIGFMLFNFRGIEEVSIFTTILSVFILIAFASVTVIGFANWNFNPISPMIPEGSSVLTSISGGLAIGMWMYSGFASITTIAGEVDNPKTLGKGLLIALPVVVLSYLLPTLASVASLGRWEEWGTGSVSYGDVLAIVSPSLKVGFVIVAIVASLSFYNANISPGSRVFFTMAADHMSPKILTKCNKFGVPVVPIIIMGILDLILCQFSFTALVLIDMTICILVYVVIFITTIVMRYKAPDMPRPIKIPFGNIGVIVISCAGIFIVFVALFLNGVDYYLAGTVVVFFGPVAYQLLRWKFGGLTAVDPEKYPTNRKTHMPFGDFRNFAVTYGIMAILNMIGCFWFKYYEDPAYYIGEYGSDTAFTTIMTFMDVMTAIYIIATIVSYALHKKLN